MPPETLAARLDRFCVDAASLSETYAPRFAAARLRLFGPLRVAVVGRVKAGKSTLLNALVGERLAATDAGECTRIVSWYRYGPSYDVKAVLEDGTIATPAFRKMAAGLEITLPADGPTERLEISWPSRQLDSLTVIDTPGLGSLQPDLSRSTEHLLGLDDRPSEVDAIVYLMRHAHAEDASFLEGFRDSGLPLASPVNTVGVLSRADETGACRLDALDSAKVIAERYMCDARLRGLVGAVVPLAGLLAETGATLEEREFAYLQQLATAPDIDRLLLSVDRFRDPERNPLTEALREQLLARFGLFGLRFAVAAVRDGRIATGSELALLLTGVSGIQQLRDLITNRFAGRARQLVGRSVLIELRAIVEDVGGDQPAIAERLASSLEAIASSAHEIAELELLHDLARGDVAFSDRERAEAERATLSGSSTERLGLDAGAGLAAQRQAALAGAARWRQRAGNPLADRATVLACEVMARTYEGLYAGLAGD